MTNYIIIDVETDNLYLESKTLWVICLKSADSELTVYPFKEDKSSVKQKIIDFIFKNNSSIPYIVGHNYLGFDAWVLWKFLDIEIQINADCTCSLDGKLVQYFDTFYASMFLKPDRKWNNKTDHSLKNWGERLKKNKKIHFRDILISNDLLLKNAPKGAEFSFYSSFMDEYCMQDCYVCEDIFIELFSELENTNKFKQFYTGQLSFFLMKAQEFTGIKFDIEKAKKLAKAVQIKIQEIKDELEPKLPLRKLKKTEESNFRIPKKPFKANGEFSSILVKFFQKHNCDIIDNETFICNGREYQIIPESMIDARMPMKIEDAQALKDYFLDSGWQPTLYNLKKDKANKPIRIDGKFVKTTPKVQEAGKICPNLIKLKGEIPKSLVLYLSYRNRLSVIKGWLKNERLQIDGRLSASSTGIASTHRQKHSIVCNVPKASPKVLLGKQMRSLFCVDDGNVMIGVDQAALEARVCGHWTFRYDDGKTADMLLNADIHSFNAKVFFPEETKNFDIYFADFNKDNPEFKPYRDLAKGAGYALQYGCSPAKLASTLGLPESEGKRLFDAYWKANFALKSLKDNVEKHWYKTNSVSIPTIDGRILMSRSKHSLINLLFQSTGAIIVDYALIIFHEKMGSKFYLDEYGRPYYKHDDYVVKRIQYMHDEFGVECHESIADDIKTIMEYTMSEAGIKLNLKVPLVGEAKIGLNWKETH